MKRATLFYPLLPLVVVAGALEWVTRAGLIPQYLFPAPSKVLEAVLEDHATFTEAFFETLKNAGLGLLLAATIGVGIAVLLSWSRLVRQMFYPYAIFFQTVPIIAIAPLLVIWFGYGNATVIASAFIVSIFPTIANSVLGLTETDPLLLDLFQVMGASNRETFFKLRFPNALPQILGGFKISAGLAVIGAIVGEFISGSGLGGLVDAARNQQRIDRVFAAVLLASLLGIFFFAFISFFNHQLLKKWARPEVSNIS
jgi:NitT/TauT family transport system permease protein